VLEEQSTARCATSIAKALPGEGQLVVRLDAGQESGVEVGSGVEKKAGSNAKYQATDQQEWTIVGHEVE
jgi:hypothetical protein